MSQQISGDELRRRRYNGSVPLLAAVTVLVTLTTSHAGEAARPIALNSVGYLPTAQKIATIIEHCDEFSVIDSSTHQQVHHGRAQLLPSPENTGQDHWLMDFSDVRQAGDYTLVVPGVGESCRFSISEGLYNAPFYAAMKAMYLWRCGTAVAAKHDGLLFRHDVCHLEDALLDHAGGPSGTKKDGVGGWHDAGDYNKYTVNGAFTVGMMLLAWLQNKDRLENLDLDLPDDDNSLPDFLEEVRWEIEWLLKMQADDGRVCHKLSTEYFGGEALPESETTPRFFCPWGSAATADFVAAAAMASRTLQPYDTKLAERCLAAAKVSYAYLAEHPKDHRPDQSAFNTGQYPTADTDDRIWAAAEMWETTGEEQYLKDFEDRVKQVHDPEAQSPAIVDAVWDWGNTENLGVFTYLLSSLPGRDPVLLQCVRDDLLATADEIVGTARRHPYARPLGSRYYWGCNGTVARQTMILHLAYRLTEAPKYRNASLDALAYLFGRNPFGRSFVTGVGHLPPLHPHDRRSQADEVEAPWPGYLVGGPWPTETDWNDDAADYKTNEVALNWNGALIYALADYIVPDSFREDVKDLQQKSSR